MRWGAAIVSAVRILVVEDDADLRFAVAAALRGDGLAVDEVADLPAADEALFVTRYDCVVFDRMLPCGDAVGYVHELRRVGRTVPVLFLTARDTVADRVEGFSSGGDDYLVKPFAVPELVARVRSLCRRAGIVRAPVHRVAGLEIDTARRQVRRDGVLLVLTRKEFAVLEILAAHPDQAVPRGELIERCWDEMAEPNSNVVEVLVSQLRRKLGEPMVIHTVRGVGYRLASAGSGG
ncbi:DNA-binding response regulator [Streptomyces violascens]|nr:DNA-binding response regulator [Streptomyces violascens]